MLIQLKLKLKLRFIFIISLTLCVCELNVVSSEQLPTFSIEAKVNNEIITNYDLNQRQVLYQLLNIEPRSGKRDLIDQLIDERLQYQFAKQRKISLSTDEIKVSVEEFLVNSSFKKDVLLKTFKTNGLEWSAFQAYVAIKALWKKTLLKLYANRAKISNYELNLPSPTNKLIIIKKIDLSEIVIPFSERGKDKSLLLAKRLQLELNAGGDFSTAAKRFSRSQSSRSGGRIGLIKEEVLPEEIKNLISKLSSNEVSIPLILEKTVVLFKVNKRTVQNSHPDLDYLMSFVKVNEINALGLKICMNTDKYNFESVLLSDLEIELSSILRLTQLYEPIYLSANSWVVLCERSIKGRIDQINKKKSIYFNNQMLKFNKKLMLKLYRKAIIS